MPESGQIELASGDVIISGDVIGRDVVSRTGISMKQILDNANHQSAQELWSNFVRNLGSYQCYAVFLVLPSDEEAMRYLVEFGKELDQISNENCMIFALGRTNAKQYGTTDEANQGNDPSSKSGFDEQDWRQTTQEQLEAGYSVSLARHLDIRFDDFPCMVVFRDITSHDHTSITLRDMTVEQIAREMRTVFSVMQGAVKANADPVEAIRQYASHKSTISEARAVSEKLDSPPSSSGNSVNFTSTGDSTIGGSVAGRDIITNQITNISSGKLWGIAIITALALLGLIALAALLIR